MFFQSLQGRISLTTILTGKRTTFVFIHMLCVIASLIETPFARFTVETELSRVELEVTFQNMFIGEFLSTVITWKWTALTWRFSTSILTQNIHSHCAEVSKSTLKRNKMVRSVNTKTSYSRINSNTTLLCTSILYMAIKGGGKT